MIFKAGYTVDIDEILGKGSFGIVHKAEDRFGAEVAAKRIHFTSRTKKRIPEMAIDLHKLVTVDHMNITRIFKFCRKGLPFGCSWNCLTMVI